VFDKDIKLDESDFDDEAIINEKLDRIKNINPPELVEIARRFTWDKSALKYANLITEK
jgi:hypothetical protein